jgi:hypothetical protein
MPKKTKAGMAGAERAATVVRLAVGQLVQDGLVQPPRVAGIDKGKLKIAADFDKMSKSELAEWYGPSRRSK